MECVIKSIRHSGRRGERNAPRIDGRYPLRIGRVVDIDPASLIKGRSCVLDYVRDRDGIDLSGAFLTTSRVVDVQKCGDTLVVETINTIYEMAKC